MEINGAKKGEKGYGITGVHYNLASVKDLNTQAHLPVH